MITNTFKCNEYMTCKTYESYRLKRRNELINADKRWPHDRIPKVDENICNLLPKCSISEKTEEKKEVIKSLQVKPSKSNVKSIKFKNLENICKPNKLKFLEVKEKPKDSNCKLTKKESFKVANKPILWKIDDRHGHRQPREQYENRKAGELPTFMKKIKNELLRKNTDEKFSIGKIEKCDFLEKIDAEYKNNLLEKLKLKLEALKCDYAKISQCDKERDKINHEIAEIEEFIQLLQKHNSVYIVEKSIKIVNSASNCH